MAIRQGGQVVQEQKQSLALHQQRELTILEVAADGPIKAEVKYEQSVVELKSADQASQPNPQPVTGKTYHVVRHGAELTVTYPDGATPPAEELAIVTDNMSSFGLPNPITQFFEGRRVQVGETLELPTELARELLGFAETADAVSKFQLKLAAVRPGRNGQPPTATFDISLKADEAAQTGVSMNLTGQLVMEVSTCRSLSVSLAGPVVASELHGPEAAQYEVHTEGNIQVAVQANYRRR